MKYRYIVSFTRSQYIATFFFNGPFGMFFFGAENVSLCIFFVRGSFPSGYGFKWLYSIIAFQKIKNYQKILSELGDPAFPVCPHFWGQTLRHIQSDWLDLESLESSESSGCIFLSSIDIELFKKPKIIKIGWKLKEHEFFLVGGFREFSIYFLTKV